LALGRARLQDELAAAIRVLTGFVVSNRVI
jgi:hypothetical protein